MDTNVFFREATLILCGDLVLEKALHSTLLYLRRYMPVDALFAEYFDPGLGAARTIARADLSGGVELDRITAVPEEVRVDGESGGGIDLGEVTIIDRPEANPFVMTMLRAQGYETTDVTVMALKLVEKGAMYGGVVALADRREAFTEAHGELLGLLGEPFKVAVVNALQHRDLKRLKERIADDNRFLNRELQRIAGNEIVGADFGLKQVMRLVRQVAPTESPVLLTGETGVGKDVVANAIHLASERRDGPFIAVNCGAIPESLLDSELFGHEKGAFTGALSRKRGRFERAHRGTIFLDEIGEMSPTAQVRLLRVLQNREIERIGGTERIEVDIRVIAATHQDLRAMVAAGTFREDLWFRLNVFPVEIPPLRDRPGDIPALTQYFLERKSKELKLRTPPTLADGALDALASYRWPGNVRELENLVERAMIIHRDEPLRFDNLDPGREASAPTPAEEGPVAKLDVVIERHIRRALEATGGQIHGPGGAGELLGVNPNTLRSRMRKLGISFSKGGG